MKYKANPKYLILNTIFASYFFVNAALVLWTGINTDINGFIISIVILNVFLGTMIFRLVPWSYIAALILFLLSLVVQLNAINNTDLYGTAALLISCVGIGLSMFLRNNIYCAENEDNPIQEK